MKVLIPGIIKSGAFYRAQKKQLGEELNWPSPGHCTFWWKSWSWLQATAFDTFLITAARPVIGSHPQDCLQGKNG